MADEVSETGVYIDTKTGKVTDSPPEEGIQLVPAGGTIDNATQKQIDAAKAAASGAGQQETVDLSATEDTADTKTSQRTKAK